jgi:CO/xanthine dehydrogenase Mo-binding subunit
VAAVAAETATAARAAAAAVRVDYEELDAVLDPEHSFGTAPIHPDGNVLRHIPLRHGRSPSRRPGAPADEVVVEGLYEIAPQDQANPAPDAALALPCPDGGVELHVATQWPQADRDQVALCLGLAPGQVRLMPTGAGGSAGTREDVGLLAIAALLAARTGRPVKTVAPAPGPAPGRRHGARLKYTHRADRTGRLLSVEAQILLDGGAYATTSPQVLGRLAGVAAGPYMVEHAAVDAWAVRTHHPPAGIMRGPGAVQVCFAHEAQMDKLAAALGMDPVELRLRNALSPGVMLTTGQIVDGPAPAGTLLRAVAQAPVTAPPPAPGLVRGIGHALGFTPLLGSEGADESSTATVRLDRGVVTVTCAAVETGQGFTGLARQIVEEVLGVPDAVVLPAGTAMPTAGPPGAGRHTWLTAGAVEQAARQIRDRLLTPIAAGYGMTAQLLDVRGGRIVSYDGLVDLPVRVMLDGQEVAATAGACRAPDTEPLDDAGQGDAFAALAFAACRVVADVDPVLGTVTVVEVTGAYDAGRVLDPRQARARVEGAAAMGIGLALVEGAAGALPTAAHVPELTVASWVEEPQPGAPFGAKGLADAAVVPVPAAVAAAVRDATRGEVPRLPITSRDVLAGPAA